MKTHKSLLKEKELKESKKKHFVQSWSVPFLFALICILIQFSDIYFTKLTSTLTTIFSQDMVKSSFSFKSFDLIFLISPILIIFIFQLAFQLLFQGVSFKNKIFKRNKTQFFYKKGVYNFMIQTLFVSILSLVLFFYLFSLDWQILVSGSWELKIPLLKKTVFSVSLFFLALSSFSAVFDQFFSYLDYKKKLLVTYAQAQRELKDLNRSQVIKNKIRSFS